MAELTFNIQSNFDQIKQARQELERLRGELQKVTKATDPVVVQDLSDQYDEQRTKVRALSEAMSRYAVVTSSEFSKKMQTLTRDVYSFEMQADSSRRKISQLSSEIAKMEGQLRKGGLDVGTSNVLKENISVGYSSLKDERSRLDNIVGLSKQARTELQNMQSEYVKYSGSVNPAKDVTSQMTNAFSNMIEEMKKAPTVGEGVSSLFGRLNGDARQLAMSLVGGLGLEQLAEHVFNVRSQFQQLEISFTTMLGSEQKAGALMDELVQTAARTPFNMTSITEGAKQLLAYGIQANEVNDTLVHLGDIAAGLNIPLSQLVYLYGTTLAQGRMFTMDLRQFMGRGIPMAEELGKIMGKTTQEVQEAVTKGEVGADLVKKAIIGMSSEGGKFGGLMDKQAETLQGRWSNIEDNVDQMFNELGKKSEGVFGVGLDLISSLVENWETLVKVIGTAAVAVGTYKAGLMAAASIQKAQNAATLESITESLDEKLNVARGEENDYRTKNGKDTKEYRANRFKILGETISDTTNIGDEDTERLISKEIELAKVEGLITDEMAEQLQAKRDLLVEQQKAADRERLEYENAVRAKEMEAEELRAKQQQQADIAVANRVAEQAKAEADLKQKIAKANESAYGQALLETNALQKKVDLQQESYDKAMDEAREKRIVLAQLDEEIKKQQQIVEQKENEIVSSNDGMDATTLGRYSTIYSDVDNSQIEQYEAEQVKLDELMRMRQQANDEFQSANARRKSIQEELQEATDKLAEAQEREIEVYKEVGAEADEVGELVQKGIDIEDGKISVTEAATTSTQANTISESTNATAKGTNANATNTETIANTANTTSENANTSATNTNSVSENVNTGAKKGNTLATSLLSLETKAATLAQNAFTWATNAVTTSLKTLWTTLLANPFTTIITLVSTAISFFAMFADNEEDVAQKTESMGNKAAEASNKVRSLFATLIQASGKEEDHKDVINELKAAYEEYGVQLDETKMKSQDAADQADELLKHENELIGVIEKRAIEMERANQMQAAYDNYNSSNNESFSTFKEDSGLSNAEAGQVRNLVSQEDLDKMSQLKQEMSECEGEQQVWNALNAQYKEMQTKLNAELVTYLQLQGKHKEDITRILGYFKDYTEGVVNNTVELNKNKDAVNGSADAAEKARNAVSGLTYKQEEQALKNQYAKKSFKQLNSEIQDTIKLCNKKLHLDIKVNYDDSQLPAWIRNMSQAQLKNSIAARKNWLDSNPKKGAVLKIGGHVETQEQAANTLAMLQARGNNIENKPVETEAQKKKRLAAEEKKKRAAEKAEREKNQKEAMAENRRKAEDDYVKTVSDYSKKAEDEISKNSISAMKDGYEKKLAQITENANKEKKALEDSIDKLVEARKKRDQTVWVNQEKGRKDSMWKQGKSDEEYRNEVFNEKMIGSDGKAIKGVDGKDKTVYDAYLKQMNDIREKTARQNEKILMDESQSMYDYLKKYGTYQEQKLAIAEEYANKIKNVQDSTDSDSNKEWKIRSLKQEQKKEEDAIETNAIMQKIDWYQVFGNVGGILKDALVPLLADLDKFVGTNKFQNLGADQQKQIVDAIQNIRNQVGNTSDLGWKDLARDVYSYQEALKSAKEAQKEYSNAEATYVPKLKELTDKLKDAKNSGNLREQANIQAEINEVQEKMVESGKKLVDANNKVKASGQKLAQTTQNVAQPITQMQQFLATSGLSDLQALWGAFDELKGGIEGLKALKEADEAAKGLKDLGDDAGETMEDVAEKASDALGEGLSKAGFIGQIVAAILKILDILKDGIGTLLSSLIDSILGAVNGILKNILSGEFIEQIFGSILSGVGGILNTVSFGGLNSLFNVGGNAKEVAKITKALTKSNENLKYSVDKLKDSIDKTSGYRAVSNYNTAYEAQKQVNEQTMDILKAQMGYNAAHHSNAYYWNLSAQDYAAINKTLAMQKEVRGGYVNSTINKVGSLEDIYKLTPEQMADIRTNNADLWAKMLDQGKYDKSEYWEQYTELAGKLEELTDQINENLTQTTFDTMKSDFINNLMDMNKSAKDFANNFTTMLNQSMLNFAVSDLMDKKLKPLYEKWANKMKEGGGRQLTPADLSQLKDEYDAIIEEGLAIRDNIADITGYKQSYSQSNSSGAFESMSQDTGEELNGRFTAVQIATEGTVEEVKGVNSRLDQIIAMHGGEENNFLTANIAALTTNVDNIWVAADEGRTILAQSLMCLQSIDERQDGWNKPLLQLCRDVNVMKDKIERL